MREIAEKLGMRESQIAEAYKVVTVDDSTYHAWMAEVLALKPNKRKGWKGTLWNQRGERTRVRYNEASGHFENYSTAHANSMLKKRTSIVLSTGKQAGGACTTTLLRWHLPKSRCFGDHV